MNDKDRLLRSFNTLIAHLEGGALNAELTETVKKCVQEIADACHDRGGTHKSTLILKIDFQMNYKDRIVEVFADINEKFPKAPRGKAGMFFCDAEGNLTRENPRNLTFEDELERKRLRDAERAAGK